MVILIPMAVIVCGAIWWYMRNLKSAGTEPFQNQDEELLILETRAVTADFLEAGEMVRLLSREKYLGTISVRLHTRPHSRVGYTICMYDSGDITEAFAEFQREFPKEDFPELRQFVMAYGHCYDTQRDALVYTTGYSAKLTGEQKLAMEMELQLKIAAHPLAEMESSSLIHTKNMTMQ